MKTHWSIKAKLFISFATIALFLFAIGGANLYFIRKTLAPYERIADANLPNMAVFVDMMDAQKSASLPIAGLAGTTPTPEQAAKAKSELEAAVKLFDDSSKKYEAIPFVEGEEAVWNAFKNDGWKPFHDTAFEIVRLSGTGNKEDLAKRDELYDGAFAKATAHRIEVFKNLTQFHLDEGKRNSDEATQANSRLNMVMWSLIVAGSIIAMMLGMLISRQLSSTLTRITDHLGKQSGDVSQVVSDLASASQELSSASTEQAAALQETASAVEEISSMVNKAAENAKDSSAASDGSKSKAEHGQEVIQQMVASMGEINSSNDTIMTEITQSNQRIAEIVQVIQEIGSKTKVINDIVFQTKLLSFNASVEAARAGEHGKGFAVVAEEVGNLAQMSGNAAKEISTMLEDSVKKVELIVDETKQKVDRLMNDAKTTVERGTQIAQECGEVLGDIVANAGKVSHMVSGIADASNEQSRGVNEISKAIHELNQSTQMNAAAANQCAGSAEQLSVQAQSLKHAAEELRVIVAGGTMSAAAATNREPTPATSMKTKTAKMESRREPRLAVVNSAKKSRGSDEMPDPSEFDEVG